MTNIENEYVEGTINTVGRKGSDIIGHITPENGSKDIIFRTRDERLSRENIDFDELVLGTRVLFKMDFDPRRGPVAEILKVGDENIKDFMVKEKERKALEDKERVEVSNKGTISELNDKGWGKIRFKDEEVQFHSSSLKGIGLGQLRIGEKVLFSIKNSPENEGKSSKEAAIVKVDKG